jgi:hypothetical protein
MSTNLEEPSVGRGGEVKGDERLAAREYESRLMREREKGGRV